MSVTILLIFVLGLVFLVIGAGAIVRGASQLAENLGVSSLIIGLTVVALGTSAPEMAVSVKASLVGSPGIVLGNIIGSNIFNILFILGLTALITPLLISEQLVRLNVLVLIGVSLLTIILSLNGYIGFTDGIILLILMVIYTTYLVMVGHHELVTLRSIGRISMDQNTSNRPGHWLLNIAYTVMGLILLIFGAKWFVAGASTIAKFAGVSDSIIGLSIVAAGTSLPEAATAIMAVLREENDIAVGNIIGSCIYNVIAVLGISGLVVPGGLRISTGILHFDLPFFVIVSVACLPIFFTDFRISKWEGALFLGYYLTYLLYLILQARQHETLPLYSNTLIIFILPLAIVTACILIYRQKSNRISQNGI